MFEFGHKTTMISEEKALKGHEHPVIDPGFKNLVLQRPIGYEPVGPNEEVAYFAMGCFWGAERLFWEQPGVLSTGVIYCGGYTKNPTYEEVCSGKTGHAEGVRIVFDNELISYDTLLELFWNNHDPTQGMRQKNDIGTQYRSVIFYTSPKQHEKAERSKIRYQEALSAQNLGEITTTIEPLEAFYYAEPMHQEYLYTHPNGYCSIGGILDE